MKAAIYARVSTEQQETDNQLNDLREFCKRSGWEIYKEYVDKGVSGTRLSRPEYDNLFADSSKKLFDVVLVWKLDRFGRYGTLQTLLELDKLAKLGVKVHSYSEPFLSANNPLNDVLIAFIAKIAEMERQNTIDRIKAKYRLKKQVADEKGILHYWGRKAKEFDVEKAVKLRNEGKSWHQIAAEFDKISYGTIRNYVLKAKTAENAST